MRSCRRFVIGLVAVALLLGGARTLRAGLMDDPWALAAWKGVMTFQAHRDDPDVTLDVDVEFAVFAPGAYENSGTDPSGGTEYVYAYQVFNDRAGDTPVSSFTVGLDPASDPDDIGSDSGSGTAGGTAPSAKAFSGSPPSSAVWYFFNNTIDPPPANEYSEVLIFTSPNAPRWTPSSLLDSGLSDTQDLPSPVPEPATLGLLAGGAALAFVLRKKRR